MIAFAMKLDVSDFGANDNRDETYELTIGESSWRGFKLTVTVIVSLAICLNLGCVNSNGELPEQRNATQNQNEQDEILGQVAREEVWMPRDFEVPLEWKRSEFMLRPLVESDVDADFAAVMESKLQLRELFGGDWPPDDFTREQNLEDLKVHERAFNDRESFAYTVLTLDGTRVLGCVYIHPAENSDAQVVFWVRTAELDKLEAVLFAALKEWLVTDWPFIQVAFPGRE